MKVEVFERVERVFLMGLRASSATTRRKFFQLYHAMVPPPCLSGSSTSCCSRSGSSLVTLSGSSRHWWVRRGASAPRAPCLYRLVAYMQSVSRTVSMCRQAWFGWLPVQHWAVCL